MNKPIKTRKAKVVRASDLMVGITIAMSVVLSVMLFIILPFWKTIPYKMHDGLQQKTLETSEEEKAAEPIRNIHYEDTFLYQEEVAEQKEVLTKAIEKVIYKESRGECLEGKITVGATIINRLESKEFPNELEKVLKAYAKISNVTEEMLVKVPECRVAAERAVAGEDPLAEVLGGMQHITSTIRKYRILTRY